MSLSTLFPLSEGKCLYMHFRSHVATEENVLEAIRLFNVSTMDAARSGINQHMNLTAEMANEIKVFHRINFQH